MNAKLNTAFWRLEQAGYFARQNFTCCQSCGWREVPESRANKAVFYHMQDAAELKATGTAHLCWSGDAAFICKTLNDAGIETEWDGDNTKRILVKCREEPPPLAAIRRVVEHFYADEKTRFAVASPAEKAGHIKLALDEINNWLAQWPA